MESSLPVFIDIPEKEQANEIRQYLISAGADLTSTSKENILEEVSCLLDACDNWLKSAADADLEALMNSFIYLILFCSFDEKLTRKFCTKVTDVGASQSNALLRVNILKNLFTALPATSGLRFDTYLGQVNLASKFGLTDDIETQLKVVDDWLNKWNVSIENRRTCYRDLHGALKDQQKSEEATRVILKLLSTYDESSATQAKEDAEKCVLDFIGKQDVFIMDHLLKLKPVEILAGQPIHKLLEILVSGQLSDYKEFYNANKEFVDKSDLVHDHIIEKMRILTMLSLAINNKEISFAQIKESLHLDEDDIEDFVIDFVKSGLAHAKIDQINEKIVIRSTSRRTFGKGEWEELQDRLQIWLDNLSLIKTSMEQVVKHGHGG